MAVKSGRDAYVHGVSCTESWSMGEAVTAQAYSASCTGGAQNVPKGVTNITGAVTGFGAEPPWFPDGHDKSAVIFTVDSHASELESYSATVLVEQLAITFNQETGAAVSWNASFGVQGDYTHSTSVGEVDSSINSPANAIDLLILFATVNASDGGTVIQVPDVRTATLTFKRPHTTFVENGLTYRRAGNLSAELSIGVYNSNMLDALFERNSLHYVAVNVNPDLTDLDGDGSWRLNAMRILGKTGLDVNANSNAIISFTQQLMFNAVSRDETDEDSEEALGWILAPSGTSYFGS